MIGRVIAGRYEIVERLGAGAMGTVYRARPLSMDRMVALKLIHPHVASPEVARRFHHQMQAIRKLEHPSAIRVLDFGEDQGQLFFAMELLEGRPLSKLLDGALEPGESARASANGALPLARIVHIGAQVVRALGAAHAEGIAHGDLKPDNVMLLERDGERDVVQVLDFGIARFVDGDFGTPAYRSPEQAMGQPIDPRADFYSLGVMLHQMATARLPFAEPPSTVAPGLSPGLEALILRLLARSPADRPATAAEVLTALEACAATAPGEPVAPPPPSQSRAAVAMTAGTPPPPPTTLPNASPRRPLWPVAVVALAVLAVAGLVAVRLVTRPKIDTVARDRLDAAITANGDPLPPPGCRAGDGLLLDRLARAESWLHDASIGHPRPQDRDALALLSTTKDADGSAEYWALLSRARLVVEPTPDGALAAAATAVARCPDMALAHAAVGAAQLRARHDAEAAAAFKQALVLAPTYVAPRFDLGLLALRSHDTPAAIAAFDEVLQDDPLHPSAHLARGQAHLLTGDLPGALDDLEQATLRYPSDGGAWMLLGQARLASGARKTAIEAFCKARALGNTDATKLCPD